MTDIEELGSGGEKVLAGAIPRELVRIALFRGEIHDALRIVNSVEDITSTRHFREAAFDTEVRARVRMHSSSWVPSDAEMDGYLRLHRRVRRLADHDLFVLMLVEAFARRNEHSKATAIVDYYITQCRRERGPILPHLRSRLVELSIPIPAQRQIESAHAH